MIKQVELKDCRNCVHWSKHICEDSSGAPIERTAKLAPEPFWYYEVCKKNWCLPQQAIISATNCKFYRTT